MQCWAFEKRNDASLWKSEGRGRGTDLCIMPPWQFLISSKLFIHLHFEWGNSFLWRKCGSYFILVREELGRNQAQGLACLVAGCCWVEGQDQTNATCPLWGRIGKGIYYLISADCVCACMCMRESVWRCVCMWMCVCMSECMCMSVIGRMLILSMELWVGRCSVGYTFQAWNFILSSD